jgi:3-methyladenine DNA glycosylase AlkD
MRAVKVMDAKSVLRKLRAELKYAGTAERAQGARAYMKSEMPFHGVTADEMRGIAKRVFTEVELHDAESWRALVLGIWRGAQFREEWYCAVELAADRRAKEFHTLDALPMFEELIVAGAWWDIVDHVAGHRLGMLLAREPKAMRKTMLAWSRDKNMWKRRSSILCQLRFKERTDLELLYACIEPSLDSKEFFLRKAIGWALRQYVWTDAKEVVRYVRANRTRLSPLSKREALKNVLRDGLIARMP